MILSRRFLLAAGAAALTTLGACAPQSKFRSYRGPQVTSVLVYKSARRMHLMHHDRAIRTFPIRLGGDPIGHKVMEGDGKTPEGSYWIDRRNPNSAYHLSLGISYPNAEDRARAEALGVDPGGNIFIHGLPNGQGGRDEWGRDWTAGCIAVTNPEMEEIYAMVRDGTPIHIFP